MPKTLDPYSNYFAKDELAQFDRAVHGQFSGVGAEISQDTNGNFIIVSPLDDSPALKAGIFAGDRILKINNEAVDDFSLKDLLTRITGTPGSTLTMSVLHEGDKTPTDVTITRAVIQVHSVRGFQHKPGNAETPAANPAETAPANNIAPGGGGGWDFLIEPEHRIAYVRITNFMENTAEELDKALLPLINDKYNGSLKGIILDLRFNPGGLLEAGIDVSERFLDSGVIVSTGKPNAAKRDFIREATREHTYPRIPLVVIINEYSASASEIVAGALKDHRRAVLIGTRSFGKGSVQSLLTLDNGNAALKLTTAYYYLPSGKTSCGKKAPPPGASNPTPPSISPSPTRKTARSSSTAPGPKLSAAPPPPPQRPPPAQPPPAPKSPPPPAPSKPPTASSSADPRNPHRLRILRQHPRLHRRRHHHTPLRHRQRPRHRHHPRHPPNPPQPPNPPPPNPSPPLPLPPQPPKPTPPPTSPNKLKPIFVSIGVHSW